MLPCTVLAGSNIYDYTGLNFDRDQRPDYKRESYESIFPEPELAYSECGQHSYEHQEEVDDKETREEEEQDAH